MEDCSTLGMRRDERTDRHNKFRVSLRCAAN